METETTKIIVGMRVQTKTIIESYPHFTLPTGLKGTVICVSDTLVQVKLDDYNAELDEWHNCIEWYEEHFVHRMSKFWEEMESIKRITEKQMIDNVNTLVEDCDKDAMLDLYNYLFPNAKLTEGEVDWDLSG